MKRPAFQFYPADWRKDVELQSCSMAAQGLWINVMCLAHECEPYGHLTINGKGMTPAQLGRQVGLSAKECESLLDELLDTGVARRTDEGVIFSSRMVRDEDLRNRRAAGGTGGAEHGIKGAEAGSKGGRPRKDKGGYETPLPGFENPPPSSSSSSSSSEEKESNDSSATAAPLPPCPHLKVLALFQEKLSTLTQPKPELWDGKHAEALRARWKWLLTAKRGDGTRYATNETEAMAWLGRFFEFVSDSDFLMARSGDFKCTLQWLVKAENFAKVVQGNYANKS